jgi:hypothetical protein
VIEPVLLPLGSSLTVYVPVADSVCDARLKLLALVELVVRVEPVVLSRLTVITPKELLVR